MLAMLLSSFLMSSGEGDPPPGLHCVSGASAPCKVHVAALAMTGMRDITLREGKYPVSSQNPHETLAIVFVVTCHQLMNLLASLNTDQLIIMAWELLQISVVTNWAGSSVFLTIYMSSAPLNCGRFSGPY